MLRNSFKNHISVDCVIFGYDADNNKLEVLLIEQKAPSAKVVKNFIPQYALPGDLVNEEESLDNAAGRVLKDLVNVEGLHLRQFHCFGDPHRVREDKDKEWLRSFRSQPEARVITVGYYTLIRKDWIRAEPGSFAQNVVWRNVRKTPSLAFDHNQIVKYALQELKSSIQNKEIPKSLLPGKFTLRQLQDFYEALLNQRFDKRNFIKHFKNNEQLIRLDEKQKGVTHKPAQLYAFSSAKKRSGV